MKKKYLITFSGGKDSLAIIIWAMRFYGTKYSVELTIKTA